MFAFSVWNVSTSLLMRYTCYVFLSLRAIVPAREKQTIIKTAISKFRVAIQLQFYFRRAIYNLGTVLYGLAEDTMRSGRPYVSPNELSVSLLCMLQQLMH